MFIRNCSLLQYKFTSNFLYMFIIKDRLELRGRQLTKPGYNYTICVCLWGFQAVLLGNNSIVYIYVETAIV
jgi:hypothetical protein